MTMINKIHLVIDSKQIMTNGNIEVFHESCPLNIKQLNELLHRYKDNMIASIIHLYTRH